MGALRVQLAGAGTADAKGGSGDRPRLEDPVLAGDEHRVVVGQPLPRDGVDAGVAADDEVLRRVAGVDRGERQREQHGQAVPEPVAAQRRALAQADNPDQHRRQQAAEEQHEGHPELLEQ